MDDRAGAPGNAPGPEAGGVPALPDFQGTGGDGRGVIGAPGHDGHGGGPGGHGGGGASGPGGESEGTGGPGRMVALLAGGAGCFVVLLAIAALVLSQTLWRSRTEDPPRGAESPTSSAEDPGSSPSEEVAPSSEAPEESGEATDAAQPVVACTVLDQELATEQVDGAVRGGGLEFAQQEGWEVGTDWGSQSSFVVDMHFADQPVEDGWYTTAGVGAVEFPEDEGGYPGAEEAARAIFQCGLSRDQAEDLYGSPARLRDYRDEATTIDGHDAWIVSADVDLSDLALLDTTEAWRQVVIVVDTPSGPAVFDGGAALGHDQQVADLEAMIESLQVL